MRIPRLHVSNTLAGASTVVLDRDAAHHVSRVLRLRVGQPVVLFDGTGGEYRGRLSMIDGRLGAQIDDFCADDRTESVALTLWQAVCRGGRMDFVIEKATELGVQRIVPLVTQRVVVKLRPERSRQRVAHWQKIAVAACEQCGMNRVPRIEAPLSLADALRRPNSRDGVALWLDPGASEPLAAVLSPMPRQVTMLVGPEGGFEDTEAQALRAAGFQPTGLGPRTLRADTAAIAALSMVQALAQRSGPPPSADA